MSAQPPPYASTAPSLPPRPVVPPLPVGWTCMTDPSTGNLYYVNNNVQPPQTQWNHPSQPVVVPPSNQPVQQYQAPQTYQTPQTSSMAPVVAAGVATAAVTSQPVMPGGPAPNQLYGNVHVGAGGPVGTVYAPVGNGATVSANTKGQVTASKWESVQVNDKITLSGGIHAGTGGVSASTGANVKVSDNASVWITPGGGASLSTNIGGVNVNIGKNGINLGGGLGALSNLRVPLPKKQ